MGLIEKPVPVHTQGVVFTDSSSSNTYSEGVTIDKTLHRILSMQEEMKTYSLPPRIRNEFELFIQTACDKTDGKPYDLAFERINNYLGSL